MSDTPRVRKIIHMDMDMFYAAVEIRENPELKGKPLVVGGSPESRSVVTTASYEARKYGIHSGMSCAEARRRCPHCLFIPPRFATYRRVSEQIRAVFLKYTNLVEMVSLDEAYLDVTENKLNEPSATKIARAIKDEIFQQTGLTASAGVAPNLFVAKIASDIHKPDGLCVVPPDQVLPFIRCLPVLRIPGIGKKTDAIMARLGIRTVADLAEKSRDFLEAEFGKFGAYLHDIARGIDPRQVTPDWERQSYGAEQTFARDILGRDELLEYLKECAQRVFSELNQENKRARTLTLKIKYHNFQIITRRKTFEKFFASADEVYSAARELLDRTEAGLRKVRLAGLALSNFTPSKQSPNASPLFQNPAS